MSKTLVVAKYREDTEWTKHVPLGWDVMVVEKDKDVPNVGREAYSYLWAIGQLKPFDDDIVVFCQGNPFAHCPTLVADLFFEKFDTFTPLGNFVATCDAAGEPHHPGLPVGESYEAMFGTEFPGSLTFTAGAQFGVPGHIVERSGPWEHWVEFSLTEHGPWLLERFWREIFDV